MSNKICGSLYVLKNERCTYIKIIYLSVVAKLKL